MKRSATAFAAIWCVLSVICAAIMLLVTVQVNTKITQLVLVNSLFLVGLGVFFAIFRDKITLLLGNYKREKEI